MNQIILHEMSKSFGKKNVIKAQNACFSPGQIYGIVGQNGCGKTVLFKCMSGLMPTTSGRIEIQLDDPAQKARPYCGVVIDGAGFNDSLSGLSNLVALADITKKADKKSNRQPHDVRRSFARQPKKSAVLFPGHAPAAGDCPSDYGRSRDFAPR